MPYPGVPDSLTASVDRCVEKVMRGGEDKSTAIAICVAQIKKRKSIILPSRDGVLFNQILEPSIVGMGDGSLKFRSYGILFGSADEKDLYGTWFDRNTKYYLDWFDRRPWLYHHGMHPQLRSEGMHRIGTWYKAGIDDVGVFLEGELDRYHKYLNGLLQLADAGLLFPSSGTLDYAAKISDDGYVEEWPIVEVSSTVSPAEWRMASAEPEVRRAFNTLLETEISGGGISMANLRERLDEILGRRNVEESDPEIVDVAEAEVGVDAEAEAEDEIMDETETGDELIVRAIQALDESIRTIAEDVAELQEIVVRLASEETTRARALMTDPTWYDRLFSVARSTGSDAGTLSDAEAEAVRAANNNPSDGPEGGGLFEMLRS